MSSKNDRVKWLAAEDDAANIYKRHNHEFVLRRLGNEIIHAYGVNKEFNRQQYLQRWYWSDTDAGYIHIYLIVIENPELAECKLLKEQAMKVADLARKQQAKTKSELTKAVRELQLAIANL